MSLKVFAESKNGFKQQRGGFLLIMSASSHVKCDSCLLQCQKMDFSFQYQSTYLLVTSFTTQQWLSTISTMTFYDLNGLFLHKSLLLPYEPLYVTDSSGGQLWAISVSLCEVSLPGINLMHKHTIQTPINHARCPVLQDPWDLCFSLKQSPAVILNCALH